MVAEAGALDMLECELDRASADCGRLILLSADDDESRLLCECW